MTGAKEYPVRKWYVRIERVEDESEALAGWKSLVRAQGWSPIGEPKVIHDGDFVIVGRLVKAAGLDVRPDFDGAAIVLPS